MSTIRLFYYLILLIKSPCSQRGLILLLDLDFLFKRFYLSRYFTYLFYHSYHSSLITKNLVFYRKIYLFLFAHLILHFIVCCRSKEGFSQTFVLDLSEIARIELETKLLICDWIKLTAKLESHILKLFRRHQGRSLNHLISKHFIKFFFFLTKD